MKGKSAAPSGSITLFLCGDVMTGRGVDQVLPHSVDPRLYEPYVKDARDYVRLAERENGPIDQPVSWSYIWGDALEVWDQADPDFKLINLETSITTHDRHWPAKGIHYRMHPQNVQALTSAGIDFCSLANNHVMDWGREGLEETLQTLKKADILQAGAGRDVSEASDPAVLQTGKGRVIIFAYGSASSGVPESWSATSNRAGVNMLPDLGNKTAGRISKQVQSIKQNGDIVIFSVHWGSNWGYQVPGRQREFARQLIDQAGVDIVYGHSSHHPRGIEVYRDKLIVYGTGDFINDYEGISGHGQYRDDLTLMYFPRIDPSDGTLTGMRMVPMQIKNFQLNRVSRADFNWLGKVLSKKITTAGTRVTANEDYSFSLKWD